MTEILILLIGIFAFIALAQTLRVTEMQRELLRLAEDHERTVDYWTSSWKEINEMYNELSKKYEPHMWIGCDSGPLTMGDTDFAPPDNWHV